MRKSVVIILGILIILFGAGYHFLTKYQQQAASTQPTLAPLPDASNGKKDEERLKETTVQPAPPKTEESEKIGEIIWPTPDISKNTAKSSTSSTGAGSTASSPPSSGGTSGSLSSNNPVSSVSNSGSTSSGSSSGSQQAYAPPPPTPPPAPTTAPAQSKSTGLTFGETLQYTKAGQPALGAPQDARTYPIIAD